MLNKRLIRYAHKIGGFDMAGTTVKDDHDISKAFQAALRHFNYEVPIELIDPLMSYEKSLAIRQILRLHEHNDAKITTELVDMIYQKFVRQMIAHYQNDPGIAALPNVEETFTRLHEQGVQVGINTGFSRDIANTIINRLQWFEKGLIDHLVGSDEVEIGRPQPLMIKKIMKQGGISMAREVAKVGDTQIDVREGINAGCRFVIGITTGNSTREELENYKPTHVIDDITQVINIIKR